MFQKENILVVLALREEGGIELEKAGANVLYTGLGKVNATYHLLKRINENRPKMVINFGSAGSKLFAQGTLVEGVRYIQRDMDVQPLGFKPYETPFEEMPRFLEGSSHFKHLPKATIGTGDSFETNHQQDRGEVVDMEAYALAKVCWLENLPFGCVKYISDGADDSAKNEWSTNVKNIGSLFAQTFEDFCA